MNQMKSNSVSNDRILDAVYDLADICGMRIDEFILHLQEEYGDPEFETDGLPEEVVAELQNARTLRRESRDAKRKSEQDGMLREEVAAFRERFPEVRADDIPESVWAEVAAGMDLNHAFAFYLVSEKQDGGHADAVNYENAVRSAATVGDGSTEPVYSREEVERMSSKDVARNYKSILRSMTGWKF